MTREGTKRTYSERQLHRAIRVIGACSDANRTDLQRILQLRQNKGLKPGTNATWAEALRRADTWAAGRRLADLSPADWTQFIAALRTKYAASTVYAMVGMVKATLPDLLGCDETPKAYRRALSIIEPARRPKGCIITDEQMKALLEEASQLSLHGFHDIQRVEVMALLHTLRDSGFRAHELLSLRNGSVEFTDDTAAYLCLPQDAQGLKTGPRDIAVARCVPTLKAWMSVHPACGDPTAPLFPGVRSRTGRNPMNYNWLATSLMPHLGRAAGINAARADGEPLTCHDFRHTRATEAAKANWHPTKMEAYFGWAPGSKMAARYSHLARSDLKDQVLRDAGYTSPAAAAPVPLDEAAAKLHALRALLRDL